MTMVDESTHRLIPHVVAEQVARDPDRIWASYAISKDIAKDGFRDVTIRQLSRAVDRVAWHIEANIGKSTTFDTLLYFGLPDIRYAINVIAAMKTGHQILLCSHFNSLIYNLSLCEKKDCHNVMRSEGVDAMVDPLLAARPMKTFPAPSLDSLLDDDGDVDPYPYTRTYEEGIDDPAAVGHTSGTTGLPKPVTWTQRSFVVVDTVWRFLPDLDGRPSYHKVLSKGKRCYQTMPIFHPFGFFSAVTDPLFRKKVLVLGPNTLGPIPPSTLELMFEHGDFDCLAGVPIYLEMVAKSPVCLASVEKKLKFIFYAGGALSKPAGDALSARTKLDQLIGSTEAGAALGHETDREDWDWFCLNDEESGIVWEACEVKGSGPEGEPQEQVYEMTFVRNPKVEKQQHVFWHSNVVDGVFRSNDLFVKHPTKAHHWKFYSRRDDIVVTKFGWNVNPMLLEREIAQHPAVKHVVVGGTGRRHICAVIDLADDGQGTSEEEMLDSIWPFVQKGNEILDAAGQLAKERILFSRKAKPFPIAGKGNVQRVAVLKLYQDDIDDMYARVGDGPGL